MKKSSAPEWMTRGKTISQLIEELKSFDDQGLFVEISTDDGETTRPISLVAKMSGMCVLLNCKYVEDQSDE